MWASHEGWGGNATTWRQPGEPGAKLAVCDGASRMMVFKHVRKLSVPVACATLRWSRGMGGLGSDDPSVGARGPSRHNSGGVDRARCGPPTASGYAPTTIAPASSLPIAPSSVRGRCRSSRCRAAHQELKRNPNPRQVARRRRVVEAAAAPPAAERARHRERLSASRVHTLCCVPDETLASKTSFYSFKPAPRWMRELRGV